MNFKQNYMPIKEKIFFTLTILSCFIFLISSVAMSGYVITDQMPPRYLGLTVILSMFGVPICLFIDAAVPDKPRVKVQKRRNKL